MVTCLVTKPTATMDQQEQGHIVTLMAKLPLSANSAAVRELNERHSPVLTML